MTRFRTPNQHGYIPFRDLYGVDLEEEREMMYDAYEC